MVTSSISRDTIFPIGSSIQSLVMEYFASRANSCSTLFASILQCSKLVRGKSQAIKNQSSKIAAAAPAECPPFFIVSRTSILSELITRRLQPVFCVSDKPNLSANASAVRTSTQQSIFQFPPTMKFPLSSLRTAPVVPFSRSWLKATSTFNLTKPLGGQLHPLIFLFALGECAFTKFVLVVFSAFIRVRAALIWLMWLHRNDMFF